MRVLSGAREQNLCTLPHAQHRVQVRWHLGEWDSATALAESLHTGMRSSPVALACKKTAA